jgi:hypothetical protein
MAAGPYEHDSPDRTMIPTSHRASAYILLGGLIYVTGCTSREQGSASSAGSTGDGGVTTSDGGVTLDGGDSLRVRRSWTTLSAAERKAFIDALLKLKATPAQYDSICDGSSSRLRKYTLDAYDYYVEKHIRAFTCESAGTRVPGSATQPTPHAGPTFLSFHREYLLELESELATVSRKPKFALPYFDYGDPLDQVFSPNDIGDTGLSSSGCPATSCPPQNPPDPTANSVFRTSIRATR